MATYQGEWTCYADVDYPGDVPEDCLVFASYDSDGYSGSASVVFMRDGQLYEDHSAHCSCNGLWDGGPDPEQTSVEAVLMRPNSDDVRLALVAWVAQAWERRVSGLPVTVAVEPRALHLRH